MIKYYVGYDLKILFVGINPHPGSYRRGVPFSNNKMFWYLLSDAGLIKESRELLKNDKELNYMYAHRFKKVYHFGLLNMVDRPSRRASELKRIEALPGIKRLRAAIKKYKPKVVCFVGKVTYGLFMGQRNISYGWQENIDSSKIYVMHAPHHGPAQLRIQDLQEIKAVI